MKNFKFLLIFFCLLQTQLVNAIQDDELEEAFFQKYDDLSEYLTNHSYEKGIIKGLEYLEEVEKLENGRKIYYATMLSLMGSLYDEKGDYENAILSIAESAEIQKSIEGHLSRGYLVTLVKQASIYHHAGKDQNAIQVSEEALAILKETGLEDTKDYATILGNLGIYYLSINDNKKSLDALETSLSIIEKLEGDKTLGYAQKLSQLVNIQYKAGLLDTAKRNIEKCLDIVEKEAGRDNEFYMTLLNNLSSIQSDGGDYIDALTTMGIAKDICENLYGKNSPRYALFLNNYAVQHAELSKYREAIQISSIALELQKNIYGANHSNIALTLNNLSNYYKKIGEYSEAIKVQKEALQILESLGIQDNLNYIIFLTNLGNCYYYLGNNVEAFNYQMESLKLIESIMDNNNPTYAGILTDMAVVQSSMGDNETALELNDKAIDIYSRTIGNKNIKYVNALSNKASHLRDSGKMAEALVLYEEVLNLYSEILGRLHPNYAKTLFDISVTNALNGDLKSSLSGIQNALSLYESSFGRNHPVYIDMLSFLCGIQLCQGNYTSASSHAIRCNSLITNHIKHLFLDLTSHERALLWKKHCNWYANFIPHIAYLSKNKEVIKTAYDALLFSKSLLLNTDREILNVISESGSEKDIELYHSISDARRQLTKIYEFPLNEQKNRTDSLENFIKTTEIELINNCKAYSDYTRRLNVSWEAVANALGDNDIAIEFANFHNERFSNEEDSLHCVAFVLKKGFDSPKIIPIYTVPYGTKVFKDNRLCDLSSSEIVWSNLKFLMDGVENVYFAPVGDLYNVPIEYFPYWEDASKSMSDVFVMHRLTSTREIALSSKSPQLFTASLFGGLIYGEDEDSERSASNLPFIEVLRDNFSELKGTKEEVKNISQYLNKMAIKYDLYTDSIGTEASFRNLSKKNINLLHIATHGFYWNQEDVKKLNMTGFFNPNRFANFSDEDKALARSGILMAGAKMDFQSISENFNPDDGIVTAKEIAQLDFRNMNLAVLSACQTGLGDIDVDGVFGLQRGFKKAGVQSLLMSLWKVNDKATQLLMTNFYKELSEGLDYVSALRNARNFLRNYEEEIEIDNPVSDTNLLPQNQGNGTDRNTVKIKPYENPRYWAAFILLDALN